MNYSKRAVLFGALAGLSFSAFALEGNVPQYQASDAQIAAILQTAHDGEADLGRLAQIKTQNPDVKSFADQMVTEHTDGKAAVEQTTADIKLQPAENAKTRDLKNKSTVARIKLQKLSGKDFDKAYLDSQITMHKDVLKTIDTQLLPNAKDASVKAMLQEQRPKIQAHLKMAEDLRKKL